MTDEWMPKDKPELLSAIEREWKLLLNVAERLTDIQMTTPDEGGWSPKDNLAHLSEWMNALMGYHLDRRPRHEVMRLPEEVVEAWDFEIINPALFERNRNRSSNSPTSTVSRMVFAGPRSSRANCNTFSTNSDNRSA